MKAFSCLFLVLLSVGSFAQQRPGARYGARTSSGITGKITGRIMDAESGEQVSFATVVVKNPKDSSTVDGVVSEEDGSFKIIGLPLDKYVVNISFVGYSPLTRDVELLPKSPDTDLGVLQLESAADMLEDVVVEGRKEVIENKIDRIVYNAEDDIANSGGDASDVLRRTPLLNVDLQGNVSLRGSQNIQILINGKPSTMFASSPADALQAIPADQIKKVEVITTPSAKYDAEGTAGIINIITKKKTPEGFSGNADLTLGTRINRAVIGLNAGKGRFGFNANGSMFHSWPQRGYSKLNTQNYRGTDTTTLTEDGSFFSSRTGFFVTAGAFYDFNAYSSLTSSFRLRGFRSVRDGRFDTRYVDPSRGLNQQYTRLTDSYNLNSGFEWSLDYIKKFAGFEGRELSFSYKIDGNIQDSESDILQDDDLRPGNPEVYRNQRNLNDGNNSENTLQVDYVHPIGKSKIEAGAKVVLRHVLSDFQLDTFNLETARYVQDPERSDVFNYYQNVEAGYVSSNINFSEKTGMVAGVRFEATQISGDFAEDENDSRSFSFDYMNFLPSVILSQKLGKFNTVKASYNRRIQRPSLRFINPFVDIENNRNISYGNPDLRPELTDQFEVSYGTFSKGTSLNFAVYYRLTNDVIESYQFVDERGINNTTFRNIGLERSLGTNIFASSTFFKVWTVRGGINLFTYNASGNVDGQALSNQALLASGNLNSSIKLKNGLAVDAFGFWRSRRQTIQGFNPSFSIFGIGAKKDILGERGSIGIRIIEPFIQYKVFESEIEGENFRQTSERGIPFRSFGINFSYKFGKLDFRTRSRRSRINNRDQKEGDDGGQSF